MSNEGLITKTIKAFKFILTFLLKHLSLFNLNLSLFLPVSVLIAVAVVAYMSITPDL